MTKCALQCDYSLEKSQRKPIEFYFMAFREKCGQVLKAKLD